MKKTIFNSILFFLISISAFAQTPQKINYQAVLRDASGQVLANQDVEIGIAILQGSETGSEVFNETHSATTNSFGLVNLQIGSVNAADMETIDWSGGPFFIQISVGGAVMGTSQVQSVPFAMHAKTVEVDNVEDADADPNNELQELNFSNNQLSITNGNTIDFSQVINLNDTSSTNELQQLNFSNNKLSITDGNSIDLSQVINLNDTSATNELQDISLSGTDLSISDGSTVDLSVIQDGVGTDNQKLSFYSGTRYLSISNGNSVKLPFIINEQDADPTNEIQALSISNDTIFLEEGGSVKLPTSGLLTDSDNDTKIEVEKSPDEDVVRMSVAGDEFFNADTTGVEFILPTNDDTSNLKVKKSNGDVVFGVDGRGLMNGDGSGLSNVKSLANSVGGNQLCQITKNYAWYQNVRTVTLTTPSSGKCFVMASGYIRWESKGWDLLLSSILRNTDPNESWDAENEFFRYLNLSTDYNCTDSSDQYVGFAQHRCFNVGAGTQTFTLWANKYTSSAKVRVDDVNLTVLFFPTAGTGSGTLKSTQLEAEEQKATKPFTSIPRRPDGGELRQRLDAMINEKREIEEVPDSGLIILKKSVEELKAENEKLKQEKSETDKRLSEIEKRIKLLMNSDKLNH